MCLKKTNTHSALSWPLAIGFLKVCPVLSCFSVTYPRTFVEGSCPLQPLRPCELEVPLAALRCAQPCLTLCNPMDRSPPGSSVHGISQARILGWFAISSSGGSSDPGVKPTPLASPALAGGFFTCRAPGESRPAPGAGCKVVVTRNVHAVAALPMPFSGFSGNWNPRERRVPGVQTRVDCSRAVSHDFLPSPWAPQTNPRPCQSGGWRCCPS